MVRKSRFNSADIPQYVIQHGNNRQAIFFTWHDYHLTCLIGLAKQHATNLMMNHAYLLHGLLKQVKGWPYSTFHQLVEQGVYSESWGGIEEECSDGY